MAISSSPEDDDDAVQDVEPIADVVERPFGDHLEQHLDGEDCRENDVAKLDRQRQLFRLRKSKKGKEIKRERVKCQ